MMCRHPEPRAPRPGSTRAWRALREAVLDRDGHACQAPGCGALATHVDHIVPVARGGSSWPGNLRALCSPCLRKGSDLMPGAGVLFLTPNTRSPRLLAVREPARRSDTR